MMRRRDKQSRGACNVPCLVWTMVLLVLVGMGAAFYSLRKNSPRSAQPTLAVQKQQQAIDALIQADSKVVSQVNKQHDKAVAVALEEANREFKPDPVALEQLKLMLVAKALDPEAMQHSLPPGQSLNSTFKNPCWNGAGGQLRCLPYVYITGSFQSGAATLYQKLSEHPDVITNDFARWQFWAEDNKPMREYVEKHSTGRTLKELLAQPKSKVILDGSASTFAFYWSAGLRAHRAFQGVLVSCWRNCSEAAKGKTEVRMQCMDEQCYPRGMAADQQVASLLRVPYDSLHMPAVMAASYGSTFRPKLIVLLRDPVQRLHTAYWQYPHYHGKYGRTAQGFLDYVKTQIGVLKGCAARFTGKPGGGEGSPPMTQLQAERHCALYFEALGNTEEQLFFHADQFMRGMYAIYLEVWMRYWKRSDILVLKAEDYFASPDKTMQQVFEFLGMQEPTDPKVQAAIRKAGQPSSATKGVPEMLPEARELASSLYETYNVALAALLNEPRWLEYNKKYGKRESGVPVWWTKP